MNADFFADSNILIYAYNDGEPVKQRVAQQLLKQTGRSISTQVLQECCNVLRRRLGFDWPEINRMLAETRTNFAGVIHINTPRTVQDALRIAETYRFSFYDSLIVAAALELGCRTLYSEDLQHGQRIDGTLTVINPFL